MELEQLRQLDSIASNGTLSRAAEELHLSQSALSRSIQKLEDELGAQLFDRTKNRMRLNDAGELALRHARIVLSEAARLEEAMAEHLRKQSTLRIGTCAPAPLWRMVPAIAEKEPELLVVPRLTSLNDIESDLLSGIIDLAILPYRMDLPNIIAIPFMEEHLYAALPPDHPLANHEKIALADLDGETFLLYQRVGFWREICERHMPHAHYVVQDDYLIFSQLSQTSPLPGFVTDASETERFMGDRVIVPIADDDAHARYHLTVLKGAEGRWGELIDWLEKRLAAQNG